MGVPPTVQAGAPSVQRSALPQRRSHNGKNPDPPLPRSRTPPHCRFAFPALLRTLRRRARGGGGWCGGQIAAAEEGAYTPPRSSLRRTRAGEAASVSARPPPHRQRSLRQSGWRTLSRRGPSASEPPPAHPPAREGYCHPQGTPRDGRCEGVEETTQTRHGPAARTQSLDAASALLPNPAITPFFPRCHRSSCGCATSSKRAYPSMAISLQTLQKAAPRKSGLTGLVYCRSATLAHDARGSHTTLPSRAECARPTAAEAITRGCTTRLSKCYLGTATALFR